MSARPRTVWTIGHSTHTIETFVGLLRKHVVTALVDVRSAPFSRFHPQFSKGKLSTTCQEHGIEYVFLGRELGARSDDRSCYKNGRVRYEKLARTQAFAQGIERVLRGAEKYRIALMCAEKEPLECHRTLLVARVLVERGVDVVHIHADGRPESHGDAMERLLGITGLPREDLYRSRAELLAEALARQEEKVAYVDETLTPGAGGAR